MRGALFVSALEIRTGAPKEENGSGFKPLAVVSGPARIHLQAGGSTNRFSWHRDTLQEEACAGQRVGSGVTQKKRTEAPTPPSPHPHADQFNPQVLPHWPLWLRVAKSSYTDPSDGRGSVCRTAPRGAPRNSAFGTKLSESFAQRPWPRQCDMAPGGGRHVGADNAREESLFLAPEMNVDADPLVLF